MTLKLRVGRWRCRNRNCVRQIFCQRLDPVTGKQAMETKRCEELVRQVAYVLGGRPGERLMKRLGLRCSKNTLLRRIKRWARSRPSIESIPAVGVDDWAWRKGYGSYGTILVDLERRQVADLLPECSADSFERWLEQHPEVTIISRDRQGFLAEGGRRGAPAAKQVADRFHLIQNLIQTVQGELAHQHQHLLMPVQEFDAQKAEAPKVIPRKPPGRLPGSRKEEIREQGRQQKVALFQMVKGLHAQGMRAFEIVRATGISRGRVDKWLRLQECPPRNRMAPRPGSVEYFREELRRRWEQGYQNGKQLLAEIRQLGYAGSYDSLTRFLASWRAEKRAAEKAETEASQQIDKTASAESSQPQVSVAMRHISPQMAAALLSKPRVQLSSRQSEILDFLKRSCPNFVIMRHLVLSFRGILCGGKVSSLKRWAEKAEATGIGAIQAFVRQLKKDWSAVEHAVEHLWSNGPTEGHINRLKTLKRQMYGRAGIELLRARLLPLAA